MWRGVMGRVRGISVLAVIQARLGSTRFPGKVLADCGHGVAVLARVVQRVQQAALVHDLVVAVPNDPPLLDFCDANRFPTVIGSEDDVLSRYLEAAWAYDARAVLRVTADCPLIDADVIDRVIRAWIDDPSLDYVCNNMPRTYPHGYDCEVLTMDALRRAHAHADAYEREHVSEYIRCHPAAFRCANVESDRYPFMAAYRLTVDYPEDLEFIRAVYEAFPEDHYITREDLHRLFPKRPDLLTLMNRAKERAA